MTKDSTKIVVRTTRISDTWFCRTEIGKEHLKTYALTFTLARDKIRAMIKACGVHSAITFEKPTIQRLAPGAAVIHGFHKGEFAKYKKPRLGSK